MIVKALLISCFLFVAGCTDSDVINPIDGPPNYQPPVIQDSTQLTNEIILQAVYSNYKYPSGFYEEDLQGGSTYYVNTVSISPLDKRENHWFELSTNSRDQAIAWSESSSVNSSYYRKLVSEKETEKYFEFRRVWEKHPTDILLSRVHKASYLDRSMYDRLNPGDTLGIFKKEEINKATVKELIEYLWFIGSYNTGGSKVLCTYATENESSVKYILFYTKVTYGDWGLKDKIIVMRGIFQVSKSTGAITESETIFRKFSGY